MSEKKRTMEEARKRVELLVQAARLELAFEHASARLYEAWHRERRKHADELLGLIGRLLERR